MKILLFLQVAIDILSSILIIFNMNYLSTTVLDLSIILSINMLINSFISVANICIENSKDIIYKYSSLITFIYCILTQFYTFFNGLFSGVEYIFYNATLLFINAMLMAVVINAYERYNK